jgi:hypothetical protein
MSSPSAFDSIEERLRAGWTDTDLVFENEDYQLAGTPEPFVYVEVFEDVISQDTIGAPQANQWLEVGQIYCHVMTPNGTGSATARQMAHDLSYLFREQPYEGIFFRDMSIGMGEPAKTFANYFAMTLSVQYERRDITSIPTP